MSVHLAHWAATQQDVVARWQLVRSGWTDDAADRALRGLRTLHTGVHLLSFAPVTDAQRWWAATLTAPWTVLSDEHAAHAWELRRRASGLITVRRPGTGPLREGDGVRVRHSRTLRGDVVRHPLGFHITTVERTLVDLAPRAHDLPKLLREALRTRRTTTAAMQDALAKHRGARGTVRLRELVDRYARLQLERCRSDAEAYAMEVLDAAGLELPVVNGELAGEEADLSWARLRLIIEIDGPQWHVLKDADAQKSAIWTAAGLTVRRIPSDVVFARPGELVALARANGVPSASRSRGRSGRTRRPHRT